MVQNWKCQKLFHLSKLCLNDLWCFPQQLHQQM
nr:MAG TPA: hypothetical protein [Caudoviricetes sp.]